MLWHLVFIRADQRSKIGQKRTKTTNRMIENRKKKLWKIYKNEQKQQTEWSKMTVYTAVCTVGRALGTTGLFLFWVSRASGTTELFLFWVSRENFLELFIHHKNCFHVKWSTYIHTVHIGYLSAWLWFESTSKPNRSISELAVPFWCYDIWCL